ncbi:MAG: hypothetical protein O7F73_20900 [Gammaproteobacteria bacterium]|nr:hypothetical protein [Gammaproteobacteria bacterium]
MKPVANTPDYETSIAGWSFALAAALEAYGIDSIPGTATPTAKN